MANIVRTVIQFRRATHDEWLQHLDVIPAPGEPCYDLDEHTLKIGDGNLNYGQLPVIGGEDEVSVSADGKSIVMTENVFKLAGFEDAEVGAYAVKGKDGNLSWVVPEVTVDDLNDKIGEVAEGKTLIQMITEATYDDTDVVNRIVAIEDDYLTSADKTVLENAIASAVANAAHIERKIVASTDEIDVSAEGADKHIYMVSNGNTEGNDVYDEYMVVGGVLEHVGNTKVDLSEYAKTADVDVALEAKADKGTTLAEYGITDAYTKEETLAKIAEKITEVNGGESAGAVLSQLNSYKETNDARVDTIEGKLDGIAEGAQVNKIEGIKVGATLLDIVDKVATIPVATSNALGVVKGSDEIVVAEDGTMSVGTITWVKIGQGSSSIILDGGGASD